MGPEEAWARWSRPKTLRAVGIGVTALGLASALPSGLACGVASLESASRCGECICTHSTHAPAVIVAAIVVFAVGAGMTWLAARALLREREGRAARRFDVVPRALGDHAVFLGAVAVFAGLAGSASLAIVLALVAGALRVASALAALRRQRFVAAILAGREARWSLEVGGPRGVLLLEIDPGRVAGPYRSRTSRHPVAVL